MSKRVLLIDDEKSYRELGSIILKEAGYEFTLAFNGEDGLKKLQQDPPDIVLLDIEMPIMDGWETFKKIKDIPEFANIPVIMCTAHKAADVISRGIQMGVKGYIGKPFQPNAFIEKIKAVLSQ